MHCWRTGRVTVSRASLTTWSVTASFHFWILKSSSGHLQRFTWAGLKVVVAGLKPIPWPFAMESRHCKYSIAEGSYCLCAAGHAPKAVFLGSVASSVWNLSFWCSLWLNVARYGMVRLKLPIKYPRSRMTSAFSTAYFIFSFLLWLILNLELYN